MLPSILKIPQPTPKLQHNEEEPILYRYKVAESLVGSKRVDRLAVEMNDRVTSKIVTGTNFLDCTDLEM